MVGHPLNGLPMDVKRRYVDEQIATGKKTYADLMPKLLGLVASVDPLHSIALMATYGLMATPTENGGVHVMVRLGLASAVTTTLAVSGMPP